MPAKRGGFFRKRLLARSRPTAGVLRVWNLHRFPLQDCRPKGITNKLASGHDDVMDATLHSSERMIRDVYDRRRVPAARRTKVEGGCARGIAYYLRAAPENMKNMDMNMMGTQQDSMMGMSKMSPTASPGTQAHTATGVVKATDLAKSTATVARTHGRSELAGHGHDVCGKRQNAV